MQNYTKHVCKAEIVGVFFIALTGWWDVSGCLEAAEQDQGVMNEVLGSFCQCELGWGCINLL